MKKVITLITLLAVVCALAIPTLASSINVVGPTEAGTTHVVKYTDIANVSKDGNIGANEYEKLNVNLDPNSSPLHLMYALAEDYLGAEAMLSTMEYYASWSEGQINIAVRYTPEDLKQTIHMADTDNPDDFCRNVALTISSDVKQERDKGKVCNFYYAVSLTTDTNEYQVAYYASDDPGRNQQGNSGTYVPKAGQDFVINYPGDGSVIFEWSIPFSEICAGNTAAAGDSVFLTIAATAGKSETGSTESSCYGIGMGDFGYMIDLKQAKRHAAFQLSEEAISGNGGGDETTATPTQTDTNGEPVPVPTETNERGEPVPVPTETNERGEPVPVDNGGNNNNNNGGTAPRTGDPMIIIAAVSALGTCGAVVIKRKFF